jgi:hypothetical protein
MRSIAERLDSAVANNEWSAPFINEARRVGLRDSHTLSCIQFTRPQIEKRGVEAHVFMAKRIADWHDNWLKEYRERGNEKCP